MPKLNVHYLRHALAQCRARETAPTKRYPAALRHQVTAHALNRRSAGVPFRVIASDLGVSFATLQRWVQAVPLRRLRRVEVSELPGSRLGGSESVRPVLFSPTGYRVEGLDVAALMELLRALP